MLHVISDHSFADSTITAFLTAALESPAYKWLAHYAGFDYTASALTLAGLPPELEYDDAAIYSYITQHHRGQASTRRGTLIIIGYQGAGKTSLVWRLRNPTEAMPATPSTDGIEFGTQEPRQHL